MNHSAQAILFKILSRKLAVIILLVVTAVASFATLGDGKSGSGNRKSSLLSDKTITAPGNFSLKSGYNFRGKQVINRQAQKYINLNTVVTYQKGRTTYILPIKKKVMLDKVIFNPNAATRRY